MTDVSDTKMECEPCHAKVVATKRKERAGIFTGILLAILPKCPFCLMAYSSTVMLCENGAGMHSGTASTVTLIIAILFCAIALASILLNYRDNRTKYALGLAVLGSALIIFSAAVAGGMIIYYFGIALLFSGVWLNASLLSFLRKIKQRFTHVTTN